MIYIIFMKRFIKKTSHWKETQWGGVWQQEFVDRVCDNLMFSQIYKEMSKGLKPT